MFKFLRRYNKIMLAIFGVLLMITFLIPQAFDKFARDQGSQGAAVASLGDGEVTAGEINTAGRQLAVLEKTTPQINGFLQSLGVRNPEHWYLLVREANAAKLVGPGGAMQIPDAELQMLMQMSNESAEFIRNTFASFTGVAQLVSLYQTGELYSDRRLMRSAEQLLHQATVQMLVFEADAEKAGAEPTEQQIQEHFNKYRDADGADGGFGYRLPDRVKIEWMKIPAESIKEAARSSEQFDGVAQRLHWKRHANDKTKNFPPPQDGLVPEVVKNDLLDKLTKEQAEQITSDAINRLSMNRRGLQEASGYVELPQDWQQRKISFPALAEDLQKKYGIALPEYQSTGDWVTLTEVNTLEGIGAASTDRFGPTPLRFPQLVQAAREFNGQRTIVPIQRDVTGPPLKGADGSIYLFRIIDADPSRTPNSVDEVRDRVIADLKRQAHYEQLVQQAAELEKEAETKGLMALAVEHDTAIQRAQVSMADPFSMQQRMQFNLPPSVEPSQLPVIGRSRPANEAIIKYALDLPPDKLADELAEEQRTWVVPVQDKLVVLVVRLMQNVPLTQDRFIEMTQQQAIQNMVAMEENQEEEDVVAQAFSFEALAKRHNFKLYRENEDSADPAAQASAAK